MVPAVKRRELDICSVAISVKEAGMHRIGIIGLGIMGRRVAAAMQQHPSFIVCAGYDPYPPNDVSDIALARDPASIFDDPSINCVYIASPPASHAGFVAMATAAGKAIFCEKPLAASIVEARACVDQVRSSGVAAAVNFPFASAISALRLVEIVRGGELGNLEAVTLNLRFAHWPRGWQTDALGWLAGVAQGGLTREVASHFLFLAGRMFGRGVLEQAVIERGAAGTEIVVRAAVRYQAVTLRIDAAVAGEAEDHNHFEVKGMLGSAALTDWYRLEAQQQLSERTPPLPSQLDALASMLSGAHNHGLATFEEAADVVELVENILM